MGLTNVTSEEAVETYSATNGIFLGVIKEVRELSKKKPDAIMSAGKVRIINRILEDLKSILANEPAGKFLDLLDDKELPQTSDAVLIMVQYETALRAFRCKYCENYSDYLRQGEEVWVTPELLKEYEDSEE